jgi:AcrR family transcriptional regulator
MKGGERPGGRDRGLALRPRERILTVAIRLFLEEGIGAVGVHRIVDEAEVALMTLYRHFGGKDGVVVAALEQWSAGSVGWLADEVDRCGDDPEARFTGLWAALARRLEAEAGGGSLVVVAAVELRRAPEHPAWKAITEHRRRVRQLLEDLVKPLEVADPPAVAARLQLLVEGAEAAAVAGQRAGALDLGVLADAVLGRPSTSPGRHIGDPGQSAVP